MRHPATSHFDASTIVIILYISHNSFEPESLPSEKPSSSGGRPVPAVALQYHDDPPGLVGGAHKPRPR